MNYYNEIDPFAAAWLRELIKAGHLPEGDVDERSIEDVQPIELTGYTQCHFFAGIGGWPLALRLAGWPDDRPVWTGSCPCQPFSAAGKGAGFDDERHLWPSFHWLISQCRPAAVFGEQVASKAVDTWIDLVQADLEALGYAFGSVPFPAASVGAPHIRDRNYWVANTYGSNRWEGQGQLGGQRPTQPDKAGRLVNSISTGLEGLGGGPGTEGRQWQGPVRPAAEAGESGGLADSATGGRREQRGAVESGDVRHADGSGDALGRLADAQLPERRPVDVHREDEHYGYDAGRQEAHGQPGARGEVCGVADANGRNAGAEREQPERDNRQQSGDELAGPRVHLLGTPHTGYPVQHPGPTNGFWRDADWLLCRDGKWRPVEPGTFPLAHGVPNRVGRLRGYGNAIVPQQAAEFVRAMI